MIEAGWKIETPDWLQFWAIDKAITTIGRVSDNVFRLPHPGISRQHARVVRLGSGAYEIEDLKSKNGTFLNGKQVAKALLADGDEVTIGNTKLTFLCPFRTNINAKIEPNENSTKAFNAKEIAADSEAHDGKAVANAVSKLTGLYQISGTLNRTLDRGALMEMVMRVVFESINAQRGLIALIAPDGALRYEVVTDRRYPMPGKLIFPKRLLDHVGENPAPLVFEDLQKDEELGGDATVMSLGIRSVLCVPMMHDETPIGIFYLDHLAEPNAFTFEDLDYLTIIARQVEVILLKARLLPWEDQDTNGVISAEDDEPEPAPLELTIANQITKALDWSDGNLDSAATTLGISLAELRELIRKYNLT